MTLKNLAMDFKMTFKTRKKKNLLKGKKVISVYFIINIINVKFNYAITLAYKNVKRSQ